MSLLKVNEVQNYNGSSLTLTASTVSTSAQLNTGGNISVTGSINVSDDSTTRSNLGLGTMATQNANAVAITGGTINTVQPASGQSLTIKDEDGNTAITIGTDNTATGYLSLNFGSYHGDSGGAGSGSPSANILDDYEEGSFTAVLTDGSNSQSFQDAKYTKIGNVVIIACQLADGGGTIDLGTWSSGTVSITGLPFTANSTCNVAATLYYYNFGGSAGEEPYLLIQESSSSIQIRKSDGDTANNRPIGTDIDGEQQLRFAMTYFV